MTERKGLKSDTSAEFLLFSPKPAVTEQKTQQAQVITRDHEFKLGIHGIH